MQTKLMLLLILCLSGLNIEGNSTMKNKREFTKEECQKRYEELKSQFSFNKVFYEEIELAALVALSFYPELSHTKIKFIRADTKTTMEARPITRTVFGDRKKRKYAIYVDNKINRFNGVLIEDVPFNGLIGLIAHELAHVVDYEAMGVFGLSSLACKYGNKNFKEKFEKNTDIETIKRGLAWQLYDWADFAMNKSDADEEYKAYKRKFYLEPTEIKQYIDNKLYKNLKKSLISRNKTQNKE